MQRALIFGRAGDMFRNGGYTMKEKNKQALNPFLPQGVYIPDGEPHVFGDRVYLFGSHDKEGGDTFCMLPYEIWSCPIHDLSDWSCKGVNYSAEQDPNACGRIYLYAPDCIQGKDGRFYLYYCLAGKRGAGGYDGPISVAVCDTPDGKYEYYGFVRNQDGTPFDECVTFDPALLNDNGVIRLYGGTQLWGGKRITRKNRFYLSRIAAKTYHRSVNDFLEKDPLGPFMLELEEDMLTVCLFTKKILSSPTKENGFLGHDFFEGASVRKIDDTYYFIYSSQKNHELCYATSKSPDCGFVYGGTIISNGDVGYNGRIERDRLNHTGTNHGSIEKISGNWYVFYHRQTHGSDYSRQACAEKIEILADGSIPQVAVTSCGLNCGELKGEGEYSACIYCHLTNGKMPHGGNRIFHKIPMLTHNMDTRYLTGLCKGVHICYRYFDLTDTKWLILTARGKGEVEILCNGNKCENVKITSEDWLKKRVIMPEGMGARSSLEFLITRGNIEILQFELKTDKTI